MIMLAHRPPSVLLFKVSCSLPIKPTRYGVQAYVACDVPTSRHGAPQHMVTCWARTNMAKTVREMWCDVATVYATGVVRFTCTRHKKNASIRLCFGCVDYNTLRCVVVLRAMSCCIYALRCCNCVYVYYTLFTHTHSFSVFIRSSENNTPTVTAASSVCP